jgi:hypothetical protein
MGVATGLCECGEAVETRQHYILECALYSDERQQCRREIDSSNLKMDKIFSPRFFRPLLRFILASYRFPQLYAPLPLAAPMTRRLHTASKPLLHYGLVQMAVLELQTQCPIRRQPAGELAEHSLSLSGEVLSVPHISACPVWMRSRRAEHRAGRCRRGPMSRGVGSKSPL